MIRSRIFPDNYYNHHQAARGQEIVNTKVDSYISESDNNDVVAEQQDDDLVEIEESRDGSVWMKVSDVELSTNISISTEAI